MARRPLSPHLSVYRFAYTMALSILHRATGLALSLGLLLFCGWLVAVASGPGCYESFARFAASWPMRLIIAGGVIAFCYHLLNGIRHLVWDLGAGLERPQARRSARIVVVATVLLSAALLWIFFSGHFSGPGATP